MKKEDKTKDFLDFRNVISDFQKNTSGSLKDTIISTYGHDAPIFLLGRNEHSKKLLEILDVDGVIDDFELSSKEWCGKEIFKSSQIQEGAIVINCSMSIGPISAKKKIESLANIRYISYSDLCRTNPSPVPLPNFVYQARQDFEENSEKYSNVFSQLIDQESKETFNKIIRYRLTGDPSHMENFSVRLKDQYFEPFLGDLKECVFVDCGGFDGDTSDELIQRYPSYSEIYFFEPSKINLELAKKRLKGKRGIRFVDLGISDSEGELFFDPSAGSASSVKISGPEKIKVTTLDNHISSKVSFIKMDLEGMELKALRGAKRHIKNDKPILAIAAYHTISDFWQIPEYVLSINAEYSLYLRHYTEGWSESVMYFIPT